MLVVSALHFWAALGGKSLACMVVMFSWTSFVLLSFPQCWSQSQRRGCVQPGLAGPIAQLVVVVASIPPHFGKKPSGNRGGGKKSLMGVVM